ncbi:hypothetical protein CRENBAI_006844 [Crenichthys baileyi]|uniref:Adhesion G protein-coupled receptor F5-like n=1 Tax=Crenichthys baileyi TaxID=28760 RepID=A0AAV9S8F9_9TELE
MSFLRRVARHSLRDSVTSAIREELGVEPLLLHIGRSQLSKTCTCIYGLPSDNKFCQPITNDSICPTVTPVLTTTAMPNSTTPSPSTTIDATTPEVTTVTNITTPEITMVTNATTPVATTTKTFAVNGNLILNMDFNDSFNTQNSDVYKDIFNATERNCKQYLSKDCSVTNLTLRSGSTIADFTLSSSSQDGTQVQLVIDEMLNQLAEKYPVRFVSTKKLNTSVPSEQITAGNSVIVTCGPPPTNFGSNLTVEWTFKDKIIQTDKPSQDRISKYTIRKFFNIHEGTYVCKMNRADGATFTQSSVLKSKPAPLIFVDPVKGTVKCGGSVTLLCSVNSDYKVQFNGLDPPSPSPDSKISYVYTAPEGCTTQQKTITCLETNSGAKETIILTLAPNVVCEANGGFSAGQVAFEAVAPCEKGKVGNKTAVCKTDGIYGDIQDNCVLEVIHNLLLQSEELDEVTLPGFLKDLKDAAINNTKTITDSPATIRAMVQILENVAKRADSLDITIFEESTKNIMESAGILTTDAARNSWLNLNNESNIWFIIGAAISNTKNAAACTAATFFIHFFYLALFFWMLASGLLLLYRTVSVFEGGLSKMSMLIIGFCLGYGAPLIVATITIAATAPSNQYIRENVVCWLNWDGSKALLGFVIPALMIVVINLIILIVVIAKLLRRRVGENAAQAGEKHVLVVIARSLAVLTPFFGLTWGLGVGTMVSPKNIGIHITFALFNSLQGFFILVFGTLLDRTVRSALTPSQLATSQGRTTSTGTGTLSSGVGNFFRRLRKGRHSSNGYHLSSNVPTASNT